MSVTTPLVGDAPVVLDVLGARVAVYLDTLDPEVRDRVLADWAWCRVNARTPPPPTVVHAVLGVPGALPPPPAADTIVVHGADVGELRDRLARVLTLHAIDARAGDLLLLHAAAVCEPSTGATVALVGASGSGKTTAARELGRTFGYVTDETLGVQDDGSVVPYPKPLSVVQGGPAKEQLGPEVAGLRPTGRAAPWLAAVLLLDRDPALAAPRIEPVRVTDVVAPLFGQISYLSRRGRPLARLQRLVEATGGLRVLRYADARDLVPVVREVLGGSRPPVPAVPAPHAATPSAPSATPGAAVPSATGPSTAVAPLAGALQPAAPVRRAPVTDWIAEGDDVLVLHEDRLHVLQAVGATVWHALEVPRSRAALVRVAVGRFGLPDDGDPEGHVDRTLAELRERGLVEPAGDDSTD